MGHVSAPFGVRGWIKVRPYTEMLDSLLDYPVWWLGKEGAWREYKVLEADVPSKGLIASLEGSNGREMAEMLQGSQVALPREQLPKAQDNEYYWSDLIGLNVINAQGVVLGTVSELLGTGANDVLVIQGDRERLVPFVNPLVLEVDLAKGLITLDWDADY